MTSRWTWPGILVISSLLVGVAVFGEVQAPWRAWVSLWFLGFCPGMAFVRLLRLQEEVSVWTLALSLSIALDAVVAMVFLYLGIWSHTGSLAVLIGLCLLGAALQVVTIPAEQKSRMYGRAVSAD